ncbi:DUF1097 family protein [Fusibacter sp. 3D3]|uniref:DUF1097 family protein n=1 Tax=Fusibacter sp. 3D3 TaxID=1048380 RepID=UPI0008535B94|nr:DUF1097 family protein [Fusibacter sp. 3D3]GAU76880.1 hypothetical protein F3D3_1478 [Fusibacter sp. 3D3]
MDIKNKVLLVQALFGAVALALLMQIPAILGFGAYLWMLFLPLMLFFAFGADFKRIPSMIVCYIVGIGWAMINGMLMGILIPLVGPIWGNIIGAAVVVFLVLTLHENLLSKTIFGNVPALFMGLATTFFTFLIVPANAPLITPLHLIGFYLYGIFMTVILAGGGFKICSIIFGMETTIEAFKDK